VPAAPRAASARERAAWGVRVSNGARCECKASGPLKVVIAGAPASGKGTQARPSSYTTQSPQQRLSSPSRAV